jgi:hypothetical protein
VLHNENYSSVSTKRHPDNNLLSLDIKQRLLSERKKEEKLKYSKVVKKKSHNSRRENVRFHLASYFIVLSYFAVLIFKKCELQTIAFKKIM